MRIAEVIGTVTLSRCHPSVTAFRWIIAAPFSQKGLRAGAPDGEPLVVFDDLGAGNGQKIAFAEGGEAAVPFMPEKKPVDAYCSCILDQVQLPRLAAPAERLSALRVAANHYKGDFHGK